LKLPELSDDELDEILRALSHAERRRLMRSCLDQEVAAGDLVAQSGLAAASVSEHLKVLRKSGLLNLRVEGRSWLYRAEPRVVEAARHALQMLTQAKRR
jgi:DNA-binding transcriptional ArsR family regulator